MTSVRPLSALPQRDLDDLTDRLRRTRWPDRETVADRSQGVPLDYLRDLCTYWADGYDWRATERRLNLLPHFTTTIDVVDIHFVHLRSAHPDATPLVLTHGWPGSFLEFEQVIAPLADGDRAGSFHVVCPSLPGYGFSGKPTEPGWDIHRIARAWTVLMRRLGYERFAAAGGDWGTSISTSLALQHPERLLGIHLVPPLAAAGPESSGELTDAERAALAELDERTRDGSGYSAVQATRPQTIGFALNDSPAGLGAWIAEKVWSWSDHRGDLEEVISRDQQLDNVSLYWFTGSTASSARLYRESIAQVSAWFTKAPDAGDAEDTVTGPTACTIFPKEVPRPSRRWAAGRFADIRYWGEPLRGGHFGAWEQPEVFVREIRAGFRAIAGAAGDAGDAGDAGAASETGAAGDSGDSGDSGDAGDAGAARHASGTGAAAPDQRRTNSRSKIS